MNGFQFLDELRRMPVGRSLPVVVWTVKDLTAEERRRLRTSVQAIMQRDGLTAVLEQLARLLPKNESQPPEASRSRNRGCP